ncbi:MAG TPA: hypothetical protein VK928_04930 [Longimicrobiales bacterium]|nr:hypothetical protein [Longimicrobiales bacterium]
MRAMRAERPDGRRAVNYFVSGLVGWPRNDERVKRREREWAVSVGVVLEFTKAHGQP